MAHKKGVGSTNNGRDSESKRLGVKIFGGQSVISGNIIVRQRGTKHHPGTGVGMGKDHTIFAVTDGVVSFKKKKNNRSFVSVIPLDKQVTATNQTSSTVRISKSTKKDTNITASVSYSKEKEKKNSGDDLKVINKIGPAFERRLNALGIYTYADLVALTREKIEILEEKDSMTSFEQWDAWIEEAKKLK